MPKHGLATLAVMALAWGCTGDVARNGSVGSVTSASLQWPANVVVPTPAMFDTIPGSGEVTTSGQYRYEIPIDVPPGRNGMQPALSLVYSSGGGDGWLGVGWSLKGISVIRSCAHTWATEGSAAGIDFDSSHDAHCWDGRKLVAISPGGGTTQEFRTEEDTYAKIVATWSGGQITRYDVTTKTGRSMQFLRTVHGVDLAGTYLLVLEQDRFGNQMTYDYDVLSPTEVYPKTIAYTARTTPIAEAPQRHVDFGFIAGGDTPYFFRGGLNFPITKNLSRIDCYAPAPTATGLVWSYALAYAGSKGSGRLLLDTIAKVGQFGGQTQWKKLSWQSTSGPALTADVGYNDIGPSPYYPGHSFVLDADGDGRDDVITESIIYTQGQSNKTLFYTPAGQAPFSQTKELPQLSNLENFVPQDARILDLDRDGYPNIVVADPTAARVFDWNDSVGDYEENPASPIATWPTVDHWPNYANIPTKLFFADLDGDGFPDLIRGQHDTNEMTQPYFGCPTLDQSREPSLPGALGYTWDLRLNTTKGSPTLTFGPAQTLLSTTSGFPYEEADMFAPITGDLAAGFTVNRGGGKVALFFAGTWTCSPEPPPQIFAPWQSDPLANAPRDGVRGYRGVSLGALGQAVPEKMFPPAASATTMTFADVNGDGAEDTIFVDGTGKLCVVQWGQGPAPFSPQTAPSCNGPATVLRGPWDPANGRAIVYDSDADGRDEIVLAHLDSNHLLDGTGYHVWLDVQGNFQQRALDARSALSWDVIPVRVGDFDGDGWTDVLAWSPTGPQPHTELLQTPTRDLLVGVTDSGASHPSETVSYTQQWWPSAMSVGPDPNGGLDFLWAPASANAGVPPRPPPGACDYPQKCMRRGMTVVAERDVYMGDDIKRTMREIYAYGRPQFDLRGRGFLGFGAIDRWSPDVPKETLTFYDNFFIYDYDAATRRGGHYVGAANPVDVWEFVPLVKEDAFGNVVLPAHGPTRVTHWHASYTDPTTFGAHLLNGGATYVWNLSSWSSTEFELDMAITATAAPHVFTGTTLPIGAFSPSVTRQGSNTYDDFGNVLDTVSITSGGDTVHQHNTMWQPDTTSWIVSNVAMRQDWRYPTGGPVPTPRTANVDYLPGTSFVTKVVLEPSSADPAVPMTASFIATQDGLIASMTMSEQTGEAPRITSFGYESAERMFVEKRTNGAGHVEQLLTHPAFGVIVATQGANGAGTLVQRQIDELGRVVSITPASAMGAKYTYALRTTNGFANGVVTTVTRDDGYVSTSETDSGGRVVKTSQSGFDGTPVVVTTTYDGVGKPLVTSRPGFNGPSPNDAESQRRDALGRVVFSKKDGLIHQYTYQLTATGTHVGIADPALHTRFLDYDNEGRVVKSTQTAPNNASVIMSYTYGNFGELAKATDPLGHVTSFGYDQRGRRISVVDPDAGVSGYAFNGFGEPKTSIQGGVLTNGVVTGGSATTYTHDVLGRVTKATNADGVSTFKWDTAVNGKGRLDSSVGPASTGGVTHAYTYDAASRVLTETWNVGGTPATFAFDYDALGRPRRTTYPQVPGHVSFAVVASYGTYGHMSALTRECSIFVPCTPYWKTTAEDAEGHVTAGALGNGVALTRAYDPATGRITSLADGSINQYTYPAYDGDGFLAQRKEAVTGRTETFSYDSLHRLVTFGLPNAAQSETYAYDNLGNMMLATRTGITDTAYTYGGAAGPHRLVSASGGATFSLAYDGGTANGRGRVTNDGTRTISFTEFDLPRAITQTVTSAGGVPSTVQTNFQYDAEQRRVQKSSSLATTVAIGGLYEKRATTFGTTHVYYIPSPSGLVAQIDIDGATQAETIQYLHRDERGSTTAVSDGSGQLKTREYYAPFGGRTNANGAPISAMSDVNVGFDGLAHDDDLGLIDQHGRLYNPTTRHFFTPDPHVAAPLDVQSHNPYSFVRNNPINAVDPTGFDEIGPDGYPIIVVPTTVIVGTPTCDPDDLDPEGGANSTQAPPTQQDAIDPLPKANGQSGMPLRQAGPTNESARLAPSLVGPPGGIDIQKILENVAEKLAAEGEPALAEAAKQVGPALGEDVGAAATGIGIGFGLAAVAAGNLALGPAAGLPRDEPRMVFPGWEGEGATDVETIKDPFGKPCTDAVIFHPPSTDTSLEAKQETLLYVQIGNLEILYGLLSPSGKVRTAGDLRQRASAAAAKERARAAAEGKPYVGDVGHGIDTTWTGKAEPPIWLDQIPAVNRSLGGQSNRYPNGMKPGCFIYQETP